MRLLTLAVPGVRLFGAPAALGADQAPDLTPANSAAVTSRPNMVVIFLDDLNPHDGA